MPAEVIIATTPPASTPPTVGQRSIPRPALGESPLVKAMLIVLIGGRELALRTLPIMFAGLLTGLALLLLR